jgi:hypothetical protein
MPLEDYFEKGFISARFLLALLIIVGFILGKVDSTVAGIIIAFYFGTKFVDQANAR